MATKRLATDDGLDRIVEAIKNQDTVKARNAEIDAHAKEVMDSLPSDYTTTVAQVAQLQSGKVDKVSGKGLSTNDYTNTDKSQVAQNKADIATLNNDKVYISSKGGIYTSTQISLAGMYIDNNGLSTYPSGIFLSTSELTNISIPDDIKSLPAFMFHQSSVKTITIHKNVKKIGSWAFYKCPKLTEVIIPEDSLLTTLGDEVFANCYSLKSVFLPSTITSIGTYNTLFSNCNNMHNVTLGTDWNCSIKINNITLTVDSMINGIFNNLKDLTGNTAKTLTLGSNNLALLTDEQKQIATSKNWNLA